MKNKTGNQNYGLKFSVNRIRKMVKRGKYAERISSLAPVYLTAVLQYLATQLLQLSGNTAKQQKKFRINPRHILLAVKKDQQLNRLIGKTIISEAGVKPFINQQLLYTKNNTFPISQPI